MANHFKNDDPFELDDYEEEIKVEEDEEDFDKSYLVNEDDDDYNNNDNEDE